MINRSKTTDTLSKLVEKRLNSQRMYWSPEVDFDSQICSLELVASVWEWSKPVRGYSYGKIRTRRIIYNSWS